jgi:hypothetical protein
MPEPREPGGSKPRNRDAHPRRDSQGDPHGQCSGRDVRCGSACGLYQLPLGPADAFSPVWRDGRNARGAAAAKDQREEGDAAGAAAAACIKARVARARSSAGRVA